MVSRLFTEQQVLSANSLQTEWYPTIWASSASSYFISLLLWHLSAPAAHPNSTRSSHAIINLINMNRKWALLILLPLVSCRLTAGMCLA